MLKSFPYFFLFIFVSTISIAQESRLFKDLYFNMDKNEAIKVLQDDSSYQNIRFDRDVEWAIYFEDLVFENNQLKVIVFKPAGNFYGINYIKTLNHIKGSKKYLSERGYSLIDEHPTWNRPQAYVNENAAYVSLLEQKEREVVVAIDVERYRGSYMPTLSMTNVKNKESLTKQKSTESDSGF